MKPTPSLDAFAGADTRSDVRSNALDNHAGRATDPLSHQLNAWLVPTDQGPEVDWSSAPDAGYRLLNGYQSILDHAYAELCSGMEAIQRRYPKLELQDLRFKSARYEQLCNRLYMLVDKVMVWELNAARQRGDLSGETTFDRFDDFVERVCGPEGIARVLVAYPVLARLVTEAVSSWLTATLEFLDRFARDLADIMRLLERESVPVLASTKPAGDMHDGRCVLVCTFDDGGHLVYKPRRLDLDKAFFDLVDWYNDLGAGRPLRAPRVVDRAGYGWCEYIAQRPCATHGELRDFYHSQGELMALLYATAAIDIHHENIVACGADPVVVDAETLIQPELKLRSSSAHETSAYERAQRAIRQSIASTGMLPAVVDSGQGRKSLLVGGIATPGSMSPLPTARWRDVGKDTMHLSRVHFPVPSARNSPKFAGEAVPVLDYLQDLKQGFRTGYDTVRERRDEVRASSGPLPSNRDFTVRAIIRVTSKYDLLRRESNHPTLLRENEAREKFFDKLWVATRRAPNFAAAVPGEHAALLAGDIPRFETSSRSRDLPVLDGVAESFFARSADEVLEDQLAGMSPCDRSQQEWLIDASFACALYNHDGSVSARPLALLPPYAPDAPLKSWLLDGARKVADRLATLAIHGDDDSTWLGIQPTDPGVFEVVPLQDDLYDGLPGVAFFLAHLAVATGSEEVENLAQQTMRCLDRQASRLASSERSVGGFVGWGGLVYCYSHLALLWRRDDLHARAGEFAENIASQLGSDDNLDVLAGAAGAIASLLVLHECGGGERALEIAELCGRHLLDRLPMATAAGRDRNGSGLTGFSHGAAGFAWALLRLWKQTGNPELRDFALSLVEDERAQYDIRECNWPDLRWSADGSRPKFTTQWCHGSPGIGLSRLALSGLMNEDERREDVASSVESTLRHGFGQQSHCLCHGDLGNLELLHVASRSGVLPKEVFSEKLRETVERMSGGGVYFGTAMRAESPGLMTGVAGIGYSLLRFALPEAVPNVLLLAPPCSGTQTTRAQAQGTTHGH